MIFEEEDYFLIPEIEGVTLNKRGQPRKRKPKEPRIYFTKDTEDAIIEYLSLTNQSQRNKLYKERIQYAFYKLAENIIHTFKFYHTDSDTIEELKHEVVTFLLEKLHLYHHSKNINDKLKKIIIKEFNEHYEDGLFIKYTENNISVTQTQIDAFIEELNVSDKCRNELRKITPPKAYSYFGTIAKRYLITYNDDNYKKIQKVVELDEINDESNIVPFENFNNTNPGDDYEKFMSQYIKYIDKHLYNIFPKKADYKAADAIMELFRKRETLEIFNKKALYIYIREITDTSTPQITKVTKKLNDIRVRLYNQYYKDGYIEI